MSVARAAGGWRPQRSSPRSALLLAALVALFSVGLFGLPSPVLADEPPTTTTTEPPTTTTTEPPTTTTTEPPTTTTTEPAPAEGDGGEPEAVVEYRDAVVLAASLLVFLAAVHVVGGWGR